MLHHASAPLREDSSPFFYLPLFYPHVTVGGPCRNLASTPTPSFHDVEREEQWCSCYCKDKQRVIDSVTQWIWRPAPFFCLLFWLTGLEEDLEDFFYVPQQGKGLVNSWLGCNHFLFLWLSMRLLAALWSCWLVIVNQRLVLCFRQVALSSSTEKNRVLSGWRVLDYLLELRLWRQWRVKCNGMISSLLVMWVRIYMLQVE
jgi:hypothetical protein